MIKFNTIGAILCLLFMIGCSNESTEDLTPQSGERMQMTMKSVTTTTRADYTDDGTHMIFSWKEGDEISVVVNGVRGNENSRLRANANGKNVNFDGTVTPWKGKKDIYSFYPYSPSGYTVNGADNSESATSTLTLPNPQSYTVGGDISNSFIVGVGIATVDGNSIIASTSMKQVMTIIRLNITNAPGKVIAVKLKTTEALFPTRATVKLSDATITGSDTKVNELNMNVTDETTNSRKNISFAMFPVNLTNKMIRIEVTFAGGKVRSIDKQGTSFVRNRNFVMNFDAAKATVPYIEVGGLKWAYGNLVADGTYGAKIGTPEDDGLYFQFGSLIGWSGGATGDGTGRNGDFINPNLSIRVAPANYSGSKTWKSSWIGNTVIDNPANGTGDPCRFYLKGNWRLPTKAEYQALFSNSGYPTTGPWRTEGRFAAGSTTSFAVHSSGLKLPAAGARGNDLGGLIDFGTNGNYWSATGYNANSAYHMEFVNSAVATNGTNFRTYGFPVRCVQD